METGRYGTSASILVRAKLKGKTNMQCLKLIFTVTLAATVLMVAGCSKKESEKASPPSASEPTTAEKTEAPPVRATPPPPFEGRPATPETPPLPPVVPPTTTTTEETPAQLAAQVQQLESTYHNTPEFQKRVAIIYELSSVESPATIDALGRLLVNERDQELKIELINSLTDIDGENDKKLAILTGAVRSDQPKEVRLEAIDALVETEDKRVIPLLQGLLKDSDEEIREAAQDGIEQLQPNPNP
jgi:type IV secretory pathway VirB10-like protein